MSRWVRAVILRDGAAWVRAKREVVSERRSRRELGTAGNRILTRGNAKPVDM